jgi:transcriptional regulator with GAF, ATPase, and Fis domain/CHASE2 domain-containing sensor protein
MIRHPLTLAGGLAAIAVALVVILRGPVGSVEDQVTSWKYQIRGSRQADTNVVIVYIDDEAVKSLGWPVRRNFYALMVKALTDLQARAIGIEVLFEDQKLDFPEYDALLAGMISTSKKVVLTSFFESLDDSAGPTNFPSSAIPLFRFPGAGTVPTHGRRLHLPLPALLAQAGGIGHLNLTEESAVPAFVRWEGSVVPAFGLELLRTFLGTERDAVRTTKGEVVLATPGGSVRCPTCADGTVVLNYPGRLNAFRSYPFLEVLKSYDALRADRPGSVPVASLKGKAVLIGVVAEGRSQFYRTPVDPRFPAVGLHAAFVENGLSGGFLRTTGGLTAIGLCFLVGFACAISVLLLPPPLNKIVPIVLVAIIAFVGYILFAMGEILLPLTPLLFTALFTATAALLLRQQRAKQKVDSLTAEKNAVLAQLHDREAKLGLLERELLQMQEARSADRTAELLEQIRRSRTEIRALTSRADDMEVYRDDDAGSRSGPSGKRGPSAGEFEGMIYATDGRMGPVIDFVGKIAASTAPVLVLGESGTGKELIARAIHRRSARSQGPFVAVNCGALSESLLESELFGHEKGAFTGAVKDKLGRFELAHGGTIFLDEIGEISEGFQVKLLRVLQEGELERVGGTRTVKVDVRVVAATNKDLKEHLQSGEFREDLFYRLNVLTVSLPPLREREGDIPLLVRHFLHREGEDLTVSKNVMEAFRLFPWRGNIRELESAVKRAALMARAERRTMITMKDLNEELAATARDAVAVEDQVLDAVREKKFLRSAVSETAEELGGLNRGTVAEYLRGECLKAFAENSYDVEKAVRLIALSADPAVLDRVRRRLEEYLQNIAGVIDRSRPWEESRSALKPKTKNLPQRFHPVLEAVGEAYFRGVWNLRKSA